MELGPKEIQETPKEGVWRKREAAINMGGKQNALTWLRLQFHFPLRQPHRLMDDQP